MTKSACGLSTCPACGQPILASHAPIETLVSAPLSTVRRTIVRKLADRYPLDVSADALLFEIYSGSHEPENARTGLSVQMNHLRKILRDYGWTIPQAGGGRGNLAMYRLEPLRKNPVDLAIDQTATPSNSPDHSTRIGGERP